MMNEVQFLIDNEKCTGCGLCVSDCQRRVLMIQNKKAVVDTSAICFECGHCLAICPENAVIVRGCDDEIWEVPKTPFLDEKSLKAHLKFRRTIRQYRDTPVEKEKIEKIIEAGRLSPTAKNSQNVRYIVIQNGIDALEDEVLEQYKTSGKKEYQLVFPHYYKPDRLQRGFLFHKAPLVIIIISKLEIDGCLAAMNMELMAATLGLGAVYSSLFVHPASINMELRESLGITEEEKIATCLAIGYPKVKYQRTAPRKKANITWR